MRNIFFFDAMLTPKILTFVYWLLLLASVVGGLNVMSGGYYGVTGSSVALGLGAMVLGAVGARIWCELLIVMFKIYENLRVIAEKTKEEA